MSKIIYKASLKPFAQKLRRDMTPQERHLWYDFLKSYPVAFRRQKQFGGYIVDFYCANARLVVELDGSQHYEEDGMARDQARDRYLTGWGLAVLRSGGVLLGAHFREVRWEDYEDALEVTDPEDVADYLYSLTGMADLDPSLRPAIVEKLRGGMRDGALHIPKEYGLFVCQ